MHINAFFDVGQGVKPKKHIKMNTKWKTPKWLFCFFKITGQFGGGNNQKK